MENRRVNIYQKQKNDYFFEILILLLALLLAMMTLLKPSEIVGDSMLPHIHDGDIAIMMDLNIDRGDIVIAKTNKRVIKRVIGLPGDTLEFRQSDNHEFVDLYVNGVIVDEGAYIKERMRASKFAGDWDAVLNMPFVIENGYYYVCGDNRNESEDSRSLGAVHKSDIYGVVIKVFPKESLLADLIRFLYRPEA